MASRVAGALLALTAAALLAVSVVAAAWWSGHPHFNGVAIKAKEINVGPLGATGCNTGGDGACMSVSVDATFETVGYGLAGVTGLLALVALVLTVMMVRNASAGQRKSVAIFVIVGSMLAALLAVLLVVVGPKIRTEAPLPFSTGLFVFFGGITAALASSVFAMRAPASTTSRISRQVGRQSRPSMPPVPMSPSGGLDMQALLSDDAALRPSSGMLPVRGSPVHSPGGALPGPSGPLGAINNQTGPQQPLFSSAPQLRPLYDATPGQGGTGGFVPSPPQNFSLRAPTPIPRDQISALAGIPTPASIEAQRPPTSEVTDRDLLGTARGIGKPKTLPPPIRSRPVSVAPIPPLVQPQPPAPPKGSPTLATSAVPPPPNMTLASPGLPRLESEGEEFDAMKTYQREEPPKKEPPKKALPKPVVPMPAKRPAPAPAPPPPKARLLTEEPSLDTDVSTQAVDEAMPQTETFDSSTNESTNFAPKPRPPTSTTQTAPADEDNEGGDEDDALMTAAREKVARTDIELPTVRPPTETAQSTVRPPTETSPSTEPAPESGPVAAAPPVEPPKRAATPTPARAATPAPAPEPEPPKRAESKLPVSTAPESLPPPTEKQAATSGPSPACPQCEAPMAWVEAHLRFYCKSCKMYF